MKEVKISKRVKYGSSMPLLGPTVAVMYVHRAEVPDNTNEKYIAVLSRESEEISGILLFTEDGRVLRFKPGMRNGHAIIDMKEVEP